MASGYGVLSRLMDGNELQKARESLRLSRSGMAELLDVDRTTIWKWETGRRRVPGIVAKLLEVSLKD